MSCTTQTMNRIWISQFKLVHTTHFLKLDSKHITLHAKLEISICYHPPNNQRRWSLNMTRIFWFLPESFKIKQHFQIKRWRTSIKFFCPKESGYDHFPQSFTQAANFTSIFISSFTHLQFLVVSDGQGWKDIDSRILDFFWKRSLSICIG